MQINPYGGVNEIGGNAFIIESDQVRFLLDFGRSFTKENIYYAGFLQPRTFQGIKDFLEFKIIPDIPNLYAEVFYDKIEEIKPDIDALFISHAHLDHFGNINLLHDDIPIYMGETSKIIIQSIQDTTRQRFGRPYLRPASEEEPSNIRTFRTGDVLQIKHVEITPVHVDHSLPGAYGYLLEDLNTNQVIGYTGDLRLHGWRRDLTEDFIVKAKQKNLKALIMEGTNINEDFDMDEQKVQKDISLAISETDGLAIANYSLRDIDRFRSFYLSAKENGRKLLISTKQAYFIHLLEKDIHLEIPSLTDNHIYVYKRPKKRYYTWEKTLFENEFINVIESSKFDQTEYIFHCEFWNLTDLIDIQPQTSSTYFYSHGDPFDEEGLIDFNRMKEWISHFHLDFKQYHASGHAPCADLKKILEEINPELLIPIHSEHPELYQRITDIPILLPSLGRTIKI